MIIYPAMEICAVVILAVILATQVVIPIVNGTRMFPMFSRRAKLQDEMIGLKDEQEIVKMEQQVESERKNLNRLKNVRPVEPTDETKKENKNI